MQIKVKGVLVIGIFAIVSLLYGDPRLMVYRYGADYHYHASEAFVGPWSYGP